MRDDRWFAATPTPHARLALEASRVLVHEQMIAHVPILLHGSARDVLIIGGGDCGLAEEVLKHRCGGSCTM